MKFKNTYTANQRKDLKSAIKTMNTRLASLKKNGLTGASGYTLVSREKYYGHNITGTSASGSVKIRSDLSNMTDTELKQIENLLERLDHYETQLNQIKDRYNQFIRDTDPKEEPDPREKVPNRDLSEYLADRKHVSNDAIDKCFYLDGVESDLKHAVDFGEMSMERAVEYARNYLIYVYRTEGFDASDEPYIEDIKRKFYTGDPFQFT